MHPPTWFEWLTLAAIVLGPALALFTQRMLDRIREKKERRVQIYLTLMRTRATPLALDHVNALNSIDVVFNGQRDRKIRAAWANILAHVNTDANQSNWQERYNDLKVDLLREMGRRVGYDFSTDYLKRQFYHPALYGNMEADYARHLQKL